jgi:hypothetical protein
MLHRLKVCSGTNGRVKGYVFVTVTWTRFPDSLQALLISQPKPGLYTRVVLAL